MKKSLLWYPTLYTIEDWLYYALISYTVEVEGADAVVVGSSHPWVESVLLALNVGSVMTLEYSNLTYGFNETASECEGEGTTSNPLYIKTVNVLGMEVFYKESQNKFDMVFSISSLDHDGLGRYGDPLNPNGDLEAMDKIRSILKPGGLLLLSVPVGPDVVIFNLHRRYGPLRLPMLFKGWDVVKRVGEFCAYAYTYAYASCIGSMGSMGSIVCIVCIVCV